MLFYGYHACFSALSNPARSVETIFIVDESVIQKIPLGLHKKICLLSKRELEKKLPPQSVHQGIAIDLSPLPFISHFDADSSLTQQCVLVLDQVTDPHNIGAVLRSAAVFGAKALIVTDRHAPKESGVMAKTASGALEKVSLIFATNLGRAIQDLKDQHFWCVGLSEKGEMPLHQRDLKGRVALVLGSEGKGMRSKTHSLCDFHSYLPFNEGFSTLNVSNAAAVALYEVQRQCSL